MAKRAKAAPCPYGVHPGVKMIQGWVADLKKKSGRTLEEWVRLIQKEGPAKSRERSAWLKSEHGLGGNLASWLAQHSLGEDAWGDKPAAYLEAAPGMVDALYSGARAALRPLHDRLIDLAGEMGEDVRVCPCKTIVPLYRQHVFAQIKPATQTRIDFGLALGDTLATGRLIDTGGFAKKDRITHRIPLTAVKEVDAEVKRWLQMAYERDA